MSLTQVISRYLVAYEAHNEYEGQGLTDVVEKLKQAPLSEINSEYNALCQQKLWTSTLLDAFYNEFLNRLLEETTFSISTSWRSIPEWTAQPFVHVDLGFDDVYHVPDPEGNFIRVNDPNISSFSLTGSSVPEDLGMNVIRSFLVEIPEAVVEVSSAGIVIIGLQLSDGSVLKLYPGSGGQKYRIPIDIQEDPEFELLRQLYLGVKSNHPGVIDPESDLLINQLIDYPEAEDIVSDGGITFEGDLFLQAEAEEE